MKQVKYIGSQPQALTTLGLEVVNGDVVSVPDDFENANFVAVEKPSKTDKEAPKE